MITINPIGFVESCFIDKFGTPRQPGLVTSSKAFLKINPEFQPQDSLQGLDQFSHLWVVFYFHKNSSNSRFHAKVHPPRLEGEKRGVFSTRSPHRPNPIGLSLVEIESIEKDGIWVRGIDIIDGTPILDIKPYLPYAESIKEAKGAWAQEIPFKPFQVKVLCENKMKDWEKRRPGIEKLVLETLSYDPRPEVYKGYEGQNSPHREKHAIRFYEGDVHFTYPGSDRVEIFDIHFKNDVF